MSVEILYAKKILTIPRNKIKNSSYNYSFAEEMFLLGVGVIIFLIIALVVMSCFNWIQLNVIEFENFFENI